MSGKILLDQKPLLNGGNVVGNMYANGGSLTDPTGAVANSGNTAYGGSVNSAAAMKGSGMYSVSGSGGSPSSVHQPFPATQKGGRRRRTSSKRKTTHRSKRVHYHGGKRCTKRHMRVSKVRAHYHGNKRCTKKHNKKQRGGYHQFMGNRAFTLNYSLGAPVKLAPNMSGLATPPPYTPFDNCPGGK